MVDLRWSSAAAGRSLPVARRIPRMTGGALVGAEPAVVETWAAQQRLVDRTDFVIFRQTI
jgi:hypothetical protein